MSDTSRTPRPDDKPLPEPVGEDGLIRKDRAERPDEETDAPDAGLADIGGGDPDKRKIA